jgi:hypothetical protein
VAEELTVLVGSVVLEESIGRVELVVLKDLAVLVLVKMVLLELG